ncbi:MAG: hypothetical protein CBC55_03845 [Gammaproteobacteria bacterium TMED95]|nr:MAG: hypothetical protein CBC55_03845 [Gammaproteobacteria bacterium TMED95]|tara:strand:- start:2123 stop:2536 length:414 start_codon:yes stop_codon:yes gene_type:complete
MTDEDTWATSPRLTKITDDIIRLLRETAEEEYFEGRCEGYEAGVEESQMVSYDEGYDTAMTNFEADQRVVDIQITTLNNILETVDQISNNIVVTPESAEQLSQLMQDFSDNGPICSIAVANYFKHIIKDQIDALCAK